MVISKRQRFLDTKANPERGTYEKEKRSYPCGHWVFKDFMNNVRRD